MRVRISSVIILIEWHWAPSACHFIMCALFCSSNRQDLHQRCYIIMKTAITDRGTNRLHCEQRVDLFIGNSYRLGKKSTIFLATNIVYTSTIPDMFVGRDKIWHQQNKPILLSTPTKLHCCSWNEMVTQGSRSTTQDLTPKGMMPQLWWMSFVFISIG